ncbi:hypothetical protein LCGC14_2387180, partial [marine sediment metagenome]
MKEKVRPAISIIAICGVTAGFFMDKISPEAYLALMAVTVIYWFKSRDE